MQRQQLESLAEECFDELFDLLKQAGFEAVPVMEMFIGYPKTGSYKDAFGSYARNSQFKKNLRIRLYPDNLTRLLKAKLGVDELSIEQIRHEMLVTLAHEFGHSMCEVYRVLRQSHPDLSVPKWKGVYDDEEDFVETFAQLLVAGQLDRSYQDASSCARYFWPRLMKQTTELYASHIQKEEV